MEYQEITNVLDTTSDKVPRFITKKWIEVNYQSGSAEDRYKPSKQIKFKTSMLRSDLCDYSDASIVVEGKVSPGKVYTDNDFPDERFPDGSTAEQKNTVRAAARTAAVNDANDNDTRDLIRGVSFRNNAPFTNCILTMQKIWTL